MTYGSVPYGECKNMKEVRERIMKGYRPTIPAAVGTPSGVKNVTGGLTHPPDALLLDILQVQLREIVGGCFYVLKAVVDLFFSFCVGYVVMY